MKQQPQQPGKLNLKNFAIVNDAIARMNVNDVGSGSVGGMSQSTSADTGRGKGGLSGIFMTMGGGGGGSSTTGRSGKPPPPPVPVLPPPPPPLSNHSTFATHSNAAFVNSGSAAGGGHDDHSDDGEAEYAQVQEIYPGADGVGMGEPQMYTFSQDTTPNKGGGGKGMRPMRRIGGGSLDKGPSTLGGSKWRIGSTVVVVVSGGSFMGSLM